MIFCEWLLSFCVLFSRFIHAICVSTSSLFIANMSLHGYISFYLSICLLIGIQAISTFLLLQKCFYKDMHKFLCGIWFHFFWVNT